MTQETMNQTQQAQQKTTEPYSLQTNDIYRNVVLGICIEAAKLAKTRKELIGILAIVSEYVYTTSKQQEADEKYMEGASFALVCSRKWNQ